VLYDEIDLAPGKIKVKKGGGAAGHNGIRSIDAHIGPDFWRVRLGVGHPGDKSRVHGYVLSDFAKADQPWLEKLLEAVSDAMPLMAQKQDGRFMSRVALLTQPPPEKMPPPAAT
ncbi:MAG: aminoacyl-tRNA hydrolase, partial [Reyranellaceae bacterium]